MKYKTKPVVIEAIQYTGDNKKEIIDFTRGIARTNTCYDYLIITTLEGNMRANVGDYIINGLKDEFYPCKPDIFNMKYESLNKII